MNLEPSSEQLALVDSVATVCRDYFNSEKLHQLADDFSANASVYEEGWKALCDLGLFSLVIPEADDGVGLGFVEAALVFEELGRNIVPGPIFGSFLASLQFKKLKRAISIEVNEPQIIIPHAHFIDGILVLDETGVFYGEDLNIGKSLLPLDPISPISECEIKVEKIADTAQSLHLKRVGCVMVSAFQIGLAEGALNITVEYAKQREQFDTPIGSFQAVKHICADMVTLVEVGRAAVYVAAVGLDDVDSATLEADLSAAKIMGSKASSFCGQGCVQVHGGMGYTWEADPHLYLKRAWAIEHLFGSVGHHSISLADTILT